MGIFSKHFQQATDYFDPAGAFINRTDPIAKSVQNYARKKEGPPGPPQAPNISTAANLSQQQDDLRQRQRGVLSNIFAGPNAAPPLTATGTILGG
jgi:hypothetical protein